MNLDRLREIEEIITHADPSKPIDDMAWGKGAAELIDFVRTVLGKEARETGNCPHALTYTMRHVEWQQVEQCQDCKQVMGLSEFKNGAWIDVWRRL